MKMRIREWLKEKKKHGGEAGVTLIEAAVAVLLLGGGILTMVLCMSGGAFAVQANDQEVTAQGLARTQLEYIKEYPYDAEATTYPTITAPEGYEITVTVEEVPDTTESIQKITVEVTRNDISVLTVEDYKVDR